MNSVRTQALWDSGAQVRVVSEKWKSQNLPDTKMYPVSDLLRPAKSDEILVPVLVSKDIPQLPIIGFNVIEEMLINTENQVQPSVSVALLRNSLRLGSGKADALLNLIQGATNENATFAVRTGHTSVVIPGGQTKCITCPVKTDCKVKTEMPFETEENLSLGEGLKLTC